MNARRSLQHIASLLALGAMLLHLLTLGTAQHQATQRLGLIQAGIVEVCTPIGLLKFTLEGERIPDEARDFTASGCVYCHQGSQILVLPLLPRFLPYAPFQLAQSLVPPASTQSLPSPPDLRHAPSTGPPCLT